MAELPTEPFNKTTSKITRFNTKKLDFVQVNGHCVGPIKSYNLIGLAQTASFRSRPLDQDQIATL